MSIYLLYERVYACVHVCVVLMCMSKCVRLHESAFVCMNVCTWKYVYVCVGVNVYVCGVCIICCMVSADSAQCNTNVN